jgi:DNA primase
LRSLQQASKVGRIDVDIESEQGQSFGHLTIETSLDKVATATLGAALETITRIGPCRATLEVVEIEDVRAAKRREVVERAKQLLTEGFSDSVMSSDEILSEVREQVRVEDITEYDGLPAGPRVAQGDAVVVVEGRADVLTLLQYGVKNAIAVEGTNVPPPIADLTTDRTATVFLDGDRGGDLILEELSQVGDIDYVAFAPPDTSVEDLDRSQVYEALQSKVPYDAVAGMSTPRDAVAATDGSTTPAPPTGEVDGPADRADAPTASEADTVEGSTDVTDAGDPDSGGESAGADSGGVADRSGSGTGTDRQTDQAERLDDDDSSPATLGGHATAATEEHSVRLLDEEFEVVAEGPAAEAFELLESAETTPAVVVLGGTLTQRILDVAAQRSVGQVVARELGEFTKRPTGVRIRTAEQVTAG